MLYTYYMASTFSIPLFIERVNQPILILGRSTTTTDGAVAAVLRTETMIAVLTAEDAT